VCVANLADDWYFVAMDRLQNMTQYTPYTGPVFFGCSLVSVRYDFIRGYMEGSRQIIATQAAQNSSEDMSQNSSEDMSQNSSEDMSWDMWSHPYYDEIQQTVTSCRYNLAGVYDGVRLFCPSNM